MRLVFRLDGYHDQVGVELRQGGGHHLRRANMDCGARLVRAAAPGCPSFLHGLASGQRAHAADHLTCPARTLRRRDGEPASTMTMPKARDRHSQVTGIVPKYGIEMLPPQPRPASPPGRANRPIHDRNSPRAGALHCLLYVRLDRSRGSVAGRRSRMWSRQASPWCAADLTRWRIVIRHRSCPGASGHRWSLRRLSFPW